MRLFAPLALAVPLALVATPLHAAERLHGRVLQCDGTPWPFAHVELRAPVASVDAGHVPGPRRTTRCDANGRFRIDVPEDSAWYAFAWSEFDEELAGQRLRRVSELHGPIGPGRAWALREARERQVCRRGRLLLPAGVDARDLVLLMTRLLPALPTGEQWCCEPVPLDPHGRFELAPWPGRTAQLVVTHGGAWLASSPHAAAELVGADSWRRSAGEDPARPIPGLVVGVAPQRRARLLAQGKEHTDLEVWAESTAGLVRLGRTDAESGLEWIGPGVTWPGKVWTRLFVAPEGLGMRHTGKPFAIPRARGEAAVPLGLPLPRPDAHGFELSVRHAGAPVRDAELVFAHGEKRERLERARLPWPEANELPLSGFRDEDCLVAWLHFAEQREPRPGTKTLHAGRALLHAGQVARRAALRVELRSLVRVELSVRSASGLPAAFATIRVRPVDHAETAAATWNVRGSGSSLLLAPEGVRLDLTACWSGGWAHQRIETEEAIHALELKAEPFHVLQGRVRTAAGVDAGALVLEAAIQPLSKEDPLAAWSIWRCHVESDGRFWLTHPLRGRQVRLTVRERADAEESRSAPRWIAGTTETHVDLEYR